MRRMSPHRSQQLAGDLRVVTRHRRCGKKLRGLGEGDVRWREHFACR